MIVAIGVLGGGAVVATAQMSTDGLPAYTKGYQSWPKLNSKPFKGTSPAHVGIKNVYASKPRSKTTRKFPDGTVIVKSIARAGAKGSPAQVAVMRKVSGKWQWAEYSASGARYSKLSVPASTCTGCHVAVQVLSDWVFTRG